MRFTSSLLFDLLNALRDAGGTAIFGNTFFEEAEFSDASFSEVQFVGSDTVFADVKFAGRTNFDFAVFSNGNVSFKEAEFSGGVIFDDARFGGGDVDFAGAKFSGGDASLAGVDFGNGDVSFVGAQLDGVVGSFDGAQFAGGLVDFGGVSATGSKLSFEGASFRGRFEATMTCADVLSLRAAEFNEQVHLDVAAVSLACRETRFGGPARIRVRYALVDLSDADFSHPVTLAAHPTQFSDSQGSLMLETPLAGRDPKVRITYLNGVDAEYLTLTNVDLSGTVFSGASHLDRLHLSGRANFLRPPANRSRRSVLAEEYQWRGWQKSDATTRDGSAADLQHLAAHPSVDPELLASLYRQLRKSLEDGKNEPGAADFYYGEMEMRRRSPHTPWGESILLRVYWFVSGYGLRASRALACLLASMLLTILALMAWGLPNKAPKPEITGVLPAAGKMLNLKVDTPDVKFHGGGRVSTERLGRAVPVALNSVLFRTSAQNLTPIGTYVEMASRLIEPIFLGLALLAMRGRIKR
ncbi:pentapeptide repeat-containing protein [Streptomyces sp. NPDC090741]|uniref:pentapeptide repeat-containing protein n=1 Tax=Streptomyces sp. NPDC090741 TaxID=3365967 RepID=UPI0038136EC6